MNDITAHHIRDVFSYSQKYKGEIFVLYIDDVILRSRAFHALSKDIAHMVNAGIRIVIVPGVYGALKTCADYASRSVKNASTDDDIFENTIISKNDIALLQTASFDEVSRVITHFARYRHTAVLGNWILARSHGVINGVDYQHSGFVERIDTVAIKKLLDDIVIPIFPAIGWSYIGTPYYLDPIDVAVQASISLQASKLIFLLDPEICDHILYSYENRTKSSPADNSEKNYMRRMTISDAQYVLAEAEKTYQKHEQFFRIIKHSVPTLQRGVERVHMLDGSQDGVLLVEVFFNKGAGLMIYSDEYEAIVPMQKEDVTDALAMMMPLMEQNILKTRTPETLMKQHADFVVYKTDGRIRGTAALHDLKTGECAEIAALATVNDGDSKGIGKKLIHYLLLKAKSCNYKKVFVLTLKTGDWFERLGFIRVEDKSQLPAQRVQELLQSKRESRIYVMDTVHVSADMF